MTFTQPQWLFLLLLVPITGLWMWLTSRHSTGLRFSSLRTLKRGPRTLRNRLQAMPAVLRMAGLSLAILAMARPQDRNVIRERYAEGVDIMMVLDTSTSMRAEDFRPNRFTTTSS